MSVSLASNNTSLDYFHSVRIDKKSWTKDKISVSDLESKGFVVNESRRGNCDRDVFLDGSLVAKLFKGRREALNFINS